MTPDGISTDDWDRVHDLAARVANASTEDDEPADTKWRGQLLALLDELEVKYGQLPSILATKAEYIDDVLRRLELLERAYDIALERGDLLNQTLTASSLAELYIEQLNDITKGRHWWTVFRACLDRYPDASEEEEWQRLSEALEALMCSK